MNLYLRLLIIWVSTAFRRRQHPFKPVLTRFRVRPWEIDVFGHMNNGRYLQIMDLARLDWMRRCGVADAAVANRWGALLGGQLIRFRRGLGPLQAYSVTTRLLGWDSRWFFIEHHFKNKQERTVAIAISRAALRKKGCWVPPDVVAEAVIPGTPSPQLPPVVVQWLAADAQLEGKPGPESASGLAMAA